MNDSGSMTLQIALGSEVFSYQACIVGPWLVGHGDLGSGRFPILLQK